jgi:hypothetical protein
MSREQRDQLILQLLERRRARAESIAAGSRRITVPIPVALQLRPSLILGVEGRKEGRRIRDVN